MLMDAHIAVLVELLKVIIIAKQGWGIYQFIPIEDLHKVSTARQFLKDDCLFFKVMKL